MKAKVTYWRETDGRYLGFLNDYPDHWTQGEDLDDLKRHLRDLFELFGQENIPGIRKEDSQGFDQNAGLTSHIRAVGSLPITHVRGPKPPGAGGPPNTGHLRIFDRG